MYKLYFLLFIEFTKIGALAIGGGYATIPFLFYLQTKYNWFSIEELTNMIAISNITPGPIGINMATYTGYKTIGIFGALISTFAIVFIPFLFTIFIVKLFSKFQHNKDVNALFIGLRSSACALLSFIAIKFLFQSLNFNFNDISNINIKFLIFFLLLMLPLSFFKKNPTITILIGAMGGIILNCF